MRLLSFLKRPTQATAGASAPAEPLEQARTRARQRLIGAAVLVGVGVIAFPVLFESQPRPIPVDVPIEIPKKDQAPPLAAPPAGKSVPAPQPVIEESAAQAGRELPAPSNAASAAAAGARSAPTAGDGRAADQAVERGGASKMADKSPGKAADKPAQPTEATADKPKTASRDGKGEDAARAQALLEGKEAKRVAAADAGRFVVQVGAFGETASASEARQKVERLGLKTYTQVVETSAGKRIRVRVGPFGSRDEADRAAAKLKAAGMPAAVLSL